MYCDDQNEVCEHQSCANNIWFNKYHVYSTFISVCFVYPVTTDPKITFKLEYPHLDFEALLRRSSSQGFQTFSDSADTRAPQLFVMSNKIKTKVANYSCSWTLCGQNRL